MLSLSPYNFYILYIAIGITFIMFLYLFRKLIRLSKAIQQYESLSTSMNNSILHIQKQSKLIQEDREKAKKKNAIIWKLLPIVLTTYHIYRDHEEFTGVKGYRQAAMMAVRQKRKDIL